MTEKIKRSLLATFLDTSGMSDAPMWARLGVNVAEGSIAYNPQTQTEQSIVEDSATTDVTGYQPNMSITQKATKGDPVYEYVNKLRKNRAILADCHTYIVNADLYETDKNGAYPAEKQEVSVQVDTYGGAGADPLSIGYTLNYVGDPVQGVFDVSTKTFTADAKEGKA